MPAGMECRGMEPHTLGTEKEGETPCTESVSRRKPQFRAGQPAEHVVNVAVDDFQGLQGAGG